MAANFILELQLNTSPKDRHYNDMALEHGRYIYNATLKYALNHWNSMKQLKIYKLLLSEYQKVKNSKNKNDEAYKQCISDDLAVFFLKFI